MNPDIYLAAAIAEMLVALLLLPRLAIGPSVGDRVVALNTASTQAALAVLFYAAYADRPIYLDVAIWLVSFSYLGAIVWARFLERGLL
ncbi:monovalent cation/H+ antiporter complex subunit F [Actinospica sp.]|jgi:multicomponent Na+:H+ antiporter subunit F|uniref:monovalent cation/H+ antiporter complex subunit F n=1 Tax=Actinospica sp. TaxID=1872142 RepID=UPI002C29FE36|nr:monovalent cation/H+ antiporter complex subunit F [Actinospica sp.]HWG23693.1 monovalent cation/H+ antiporter complex subunit F [Actinospica sp.]